MCVLSTKHLNELHYKGGIKYYRPYATQTHKPLKFMILADLIMFLYNEHKNFLYISHFLKTQNLTKS